MRKYLKYFLWLSASLVLSLSPLPLALAEEYTIGPRDTLKITVWGHDDLSQDYPVDQDGLVPFPLVGRVRASGLTTKEFAARLTELLEKDYLVNPQVIVSIKEYLSRKVYVLGGADKPGLFYLSGPTTLLEIVSQAGGLSKTAGKHLILFRNHRFTPGGTDDGNTIFRLSLEKIQAGDQSENLLLQDGDTIFVPKAQAVFVVGEVKSAGSFPLERETSALEAVTIAGGFTDRATPSGVKVIRRAADGQEETFSLDLSGSAPKDRAFKILDGDTVLVPRGNTFFVFGEVKNPGVYQLGKDTNILEGITIAGGFTDKAAPARTRVIRNTQKGEQVIYIDVNNIIKRGQREKAILLQENDVIVVPQSFF